jgi:hypothetical protein
MKRNLFLIFTFVADDGPAAPDRNDRSIHMAHAEGIAAMVPPLFEKRKIYIYENPTVYTPAGRRKPTANLAIQNAINQGSLVLNFAGHGNPRLWTHEAVFVKETDFPCSVIRENTFSWLRQHVIIRISICLLINRAVNCLCL